MTMIGPAKAKKPGEGKYSGYVKHFSEKNQKEWTYFPNHEGKIINALTYCSLDIPQACHWCHVGLVYGSDTGYALGESGVKIMGPDGKVVEAEGVGLPHKHYWDETFYWLGTDPKHPFDLGGEVEFWIGEGEEAEKFVFTTTTVAHVPAMVIHNPHVFRKVKRPIIMMALINAPLAAVEWADWHFPPGFDKKILKKYGYFESKDGKRWLKTPAGKRYIESVGGID